jgi:hypothetical protein
MRRTVLVLTMALAMVLACAGVVLAQGSTTPTTTPAPEQQSSTANALPNGQCSSTKVGPPIPVMTRNLYLGADVDPIFKAAKTGGDVVGATTKAWNTIKETNFPERAEALADEMDDSDPLLVGLQEVTLFRTGPPDSFTSNPTPATHVEYDYLKILLRELYERDLHYVPVTITKNADGELPGYTAPGVLQDIRLTDRDVILVRMNLPGSKPQLSNPQTGNFVNYVSAPLPLLRGWGSIDVTLRGQTFRFINTHLEPESTDPDVKDEVNAIQVAQGDEILSGPANTDLPVILVGDFNSQADTDPPPEVPPGTLTYRNLIEAGLADAWRVTHPGEPGYTWGQAENLRNEESNLTQRLDLVLFRDGLSEGGLCALDADVVGDEQSDRTPSGLWPSDHAGVVATLRGE